MDINHMLSTTVIGCGGGGGGGGGINVTGGGGASTGFSASSCDWVSLLGRTVGSLASVGTTCSGGLSEDVETDDGTWDERVEVIKVVGGLVERVLRFEDKIVGLLLEGCCVLSSSFCVLVFGCVPFASSFPSPLSLSSFSSSFSSLSSSSADGSGVASATEWAGVSEVKFFSSSLGLNVGVGDSIDLSFSWPSKLGVMELMMDCRLERLTVVNMSMENRRADVSSSLENSTITKAGRRLPFLITTRDLNIKDGKWKGKTRYKIELSLTRVTARDEF